MPSHNTRIVHDGYFRLEIIDTVVPEPPGGAHTNPDEAARQLRRILVSEMTTLQAKSTKKILKDRYKKYRLWRDPERVLAEMAPCLQANKLREDQARDVVLRTFPDR